MNNNHICVTEHTLRGWITNDTWQFRLVANVRRAAIISSCIQKRSKYRFSPEVPIINWRLSMITWLMSWTYCACSTACLNISFRWKTVSYWNVLYIGKRRIDGATTSITTLIFCWPWNVMKYIGNFSNSAAYRSKDVKSLSNGCPAICRSKVVAKRVFRISNDPHKVDTPCITRSSEYSAINVVLPQPVGPVNSVNSPRRWPFIILFNEGKRFHLIPCTLSIFCRSLNTSLRSERNVVMASCTIGFAEESISLRFNDCCTALYGVGCASVGLTK